MTIAPTITRPTVKPAIVPLSTPSLCFVAAILEVVVASVFVPCVVDKRPFENVANDEEVVDGAVVVAVDPIDGNDVIVSLASSSRVRYQLVLQKPSLFCSSVVPWALTTLKTNGFVIFVSSARNSHWYHSVAKLTRGLISRVYDNLIMLLHSPTSCTEFATFPFW